MKPRDEATRLTITLLKPLFRWTHFPWTPTHDKAVARIIECIIIAAAERGAQLALERLDDEEPEDHVAALQRLLSPERTMQTQPLARHTEPLIKESQRRPGYAAPVDDHAIAWLRRVQEQHNAEAEAMRSQQ